MYLTHPKTLYLRSYPSKHVYDGEWRMCAVDSETPIKHDIDIATQYNGMPWELANEPTTGFRLIPHKFASVTDWMVVDPRGFMIRMNQDLVNILLASVTIKNGVIQDTCTWLLDRKRSPCLLPVRSDKYLEAARVQYLKTRKVSKRDVKRGNIVTLQDGTVGRYLGLCRAAYFGSYENKLNSDLLEIVGYRTSKMYLLENMADRKIMSYASGMIIAEVKEDCAMSLLEVQDRIYSYSKSQWDWSIRDSFYIAPFKFDAKDLVSEKVEVDLEDCILGQRPLIALNRANSVVTDWRSPNRRFYSVVDSFYDSTYVSSYIFNPTPNSKDHKWSFIMKKRPEWKVYKAHTKQEVHGFKVHVPGKEGLARLIMGPLPV